MYILYDLFSATEEFWNEWIKSEEGIMDDRYIIQLYKRAVTAVPQVEVWLECLKFLKIRRFHVPPSVTNAVVRRACEHALRELGLHATEGPKLWSFYRHFEVQILNNMMEHGLTPGDSSVSESPNIPIVESSKIRSPNTMDPNCSNSSSHHKRLHGTPTPSTDGNQVLSVDLSQFSEASDNCRRVPTPATDGSRIIQQVNRIRNLFSRQMTLPLAGLPDLFDEYRYVYL